MNHPTKFDPPESVVPYAFSELLNRLRKTRQAGQKGSEISAEEREVFNFGVQQRKRVLEHTLFLVFGQWAVYRQGISRLKSRGIRLAYGIGSVVSTGYFVKYRASLVTRDMFSNIVTTSTASPLGNEARIVLAELEGPDGPFFRSTCNQKGFNEDLTEVVNALDSGNEIDPNSDHLHPQFRLRPRLLTNSQTAHPQVVISGKQTPMKVGAQRLEIQRKLKEKEEKDRWGFENDRDSSNNVSSRTTLRRQPDDYMLGPSVEWSQQQMEAAQSGNVDELTRQSRVERAKQRKTAFDRGEQIDEDGKDDLWGKPFDFAHAVSPENDDWDSNDSPEERQSEHELSEMTPSQRRAAERRRRRMQARTQNGANGNSY